MSTDFNKLDKIRLTKLVNAIEKAASIAKASTRPEHLILAEQLRNSGFDHRFAKVATGAYNKRKTVDHMTSNPELTRGNSFAIVDADEVAAALGGVSKTASVAGMTQGLVFKYTKPQQAMSKVAGTAQHPVVPGMRYSADLTVGEIQLRIATGIDKLARAMLDYTREFAGAVGMQKRAALAVLEYISNHKQASVLWDAAVTKYGPALFDVFGDALPEDAKLLKTAGYVFTDTTAEDMVDHLVAATVILLDKAESLNKTASMFAKYAGNVDTILSYIQNLLLLGRLTKLARSGMGLLLSAPTLSLLGASGAVRSAALTAGLLLPALGVAADAAGLRARSALRYITTPFLVADRDLLQTLALSDVLADRLLAAQYGVADIADAISKSFLVLPDLLRPDKRELLRAVVRTRLAQNNKMSLADLTAILKTMLRLLGARGMSALLSLKMRDTLESSSEAPASNLFAALGGIASHAIANSIATSSELRDTIKQLFEEEKKDSDGKGGGSGGGKSGSGSGSGKNRKATGGIGGNNPGAGANAKNNKNNTQPKNIGGGGNAGNLPGGGNGKGGNQQNTGGKGNGKQKTGVI